MPTSYRPQKSALLQRWGSLSGNLGIHRNEDLDLLIVPISSPAGPAFVDWIIRKRSIFTRTMSGRQAASDPKGPTGQLCHWAYDLKLSQVPKHIQLRAKLIILDGLGCGLVGAHLPWSEKAAKAILELEPPGNCSLLGWEDKLLSASAAALLNSTFIQAFELDDWHPHAPLHSAALLLPALLAAYEHVTTIDGTSSISGESFLLATIVGLEVGPRIGLGLGGDRMLSSGWHSGAVFGGPAVAVAVSKLLGLSPQRMEWALGTACTQAGGLMAAQFESMVKRMQHGFAARNGVLAAFLARSDYTGIERVLERSYGGFFRTFSSDLASLPADHTVSPFESLGTDWELEEILIKPYALMAALHAPIDCIRLLQNKHKTIFQNAANIKSIMVQMGGTALKKGGWKIETDEVEPIAAQMNTAYAIAMQLIDWQVTPASFAPDKLNRRPVRELNDKIKCVRNEEFDGSLKTRITVSLLEGGEDVAEYVEMPRGVRPKMDDIEIKEKYLDLTSGLMGDKRSRLILDEVMSIEEKSSLVHLLGILRRNVECVLK